MSRKALSEFQWVAGGPDRTRSEESSPLGRWWYRHGARYADVPGTRCSPGCNGWWRPSEARPPVPSNQV